MPDIPYSPGIPRLVGLTGVPYQSLHEPKLWPKPLHFWGVASPQRRPYTLFPCL